MARYALNRRIAAAAFAAAAAAIITAAIFGAFSAEGGKVTEATSQRVVPEFQADGSGGVDVAVYEYSTEKTFEVRESATVRERRLVGTVETRRLTSEGSWPDDYVLAARANGWGFDELSACTEHLIGLSGSDRFTGEQCRTLASGIVRGDFESLRWLRRMFPSTIVSP